MSGNVLVSVEIVPHTCGGCGCIFGMEATFLRNLRDTNGSFMCPRGCSRQFTGETSQQRAEKAAKRAQELLDMERRAHAARIATLERTERQLYAAKGRITRLKNRAANGVCPCCNRSFDNLKRHMDSKHPDFTKHEE